MERFEIPFIKFDPEWQIKFMVKPASLFSFLVRKIGAPNDVLVWFYESGSYYHWEILVVSMLEDNSYHPYFYTIANIEHGSKNEAQQLIKCIEESLYTKELEEPWTEEEY